MSGERIAKGEGTVIVMDLRANRSVFIRYHLKKAKKGIVKRNIFDPTALPKFH